jgi:mercuric ion binding protein
MEISMTHRGAIACFAVLLSTGVAEAAQTTAVLNVHHAYCALCPSIVTRTLKNVSGVRVVEVAEPNKAGDMTATVTYDDTVTSVPALITATTNAGYPSELAKK